jgi:hypothetical protein
MRPPALLPIRRKVCCGFLSSLKIHRIGRLRTRDLWVQWHHVKDLCISDTDIQNSHSFVHSSYLPQMSVLVGLPESCGGRVRSYHQPAPWLTTLHITWGLKNRPFGGRGSETWSHPIIISELVTFADVICCKMRQENVLFTLRASDFVVCVILLENSTWQFTFNALVS